MAYERKLETMGLPYKRADVSGFFRCEFMKNDYAESLIYCTVNIQSINRKGVMFDEKNYANFYYTVSYVHYT